ncbi:MAG: glycosyltransferase, partial [Erysipelotrichaceae bacterium]|nr:glycosyltransferase [Erysipelotrichaceae bacterium]
MPKISVIIPIYNVEKYLRQCLDSIINQTLKDIEIICIDDGSTDASINILKEYASNDKRLKYMTQKNQYAGVARNNGIKEATGEYLLFLDSDDFFDITLCEKTYLKAIEKDANIVLFGGKRFDQRINEYLASPWYFKTEMLPQNNPFSRIDMDGRLLELTFLGPWNKLFKKSFIQNNHIQFQPLHNSNDDYFVAVALSLANRITYVDEELVFHRVGLQNNLQSKKYQHPLCFMEAYEAIYDKLNQEGIYDDVKQGFVSRLLTDCIYHFKTMKDSHAKWLICQNIKEEHFNRMGILEAEVKGSSIKNQKYIKGLFNAYQWHENMCCIDGYEYRIISQSKIEHPKISIIIYLSSINHCINNLFNQKQNDIEFIIITNFINHIKIDNNITVIEQNNDNLSYARNIGLDFSKGEYVLFLDENNQVILNELEKIYQYACSHKLEVLYFNQYNQCDIMNGKDYFKYLVNNELLIPNIQYTLFNAYYMKKMNLKFSFDVHIDQYLSYRNLVFADKVLCTSYNIYQINILNSEQSYQSFYDYFISAYH